MCCVFMFSVMCYYDHIRAVVVHITCLDYIIHSVSGVVAFNGVRWSCTAQSRYRSIHLSDYNLY